MASVLRPFSGILNPGNFQVPSGPGQYTIDSSNRLANGLIACWLPGLSLVDLAAGLTLAPFSGGSPQDITREGPAASALAASTGASSNTTLSTNFTTGWTGMTIRWRGQEVSLPNSLAPFLAITYDAGGTTSPFFVAGFRYNGGTVQALWNSAGSFSNLVGTVPITTAGALYDLICTFVVNGNTSIYVNGVLDTSAAFGANGPTASTSAIELNNDIGNLATNFTKSACNIAQIWNRALSAEEIAALYLSPYSFIVPAEYEMPELLFIAPPNFPAAFSILSNIVTQTEVISY